MNDPIESIQWQRAGEDVVIYMSRLRMHQAADIPMNFYANVRGDCLLAALRAEEDYQHARSSLMNRKV